MDEIKIESGKEIPPAPKGRNEGGVSLALRQMKKGDSFFLPGAGKRAGSIRSLASYFGVKVSIRKMDGGLRVWKTGETK